MGSEGYISIVNWERFQHYKDQTRPAWIKVYRDLLDDDRYDDLPDASKAHLIGLMLMASRHGNKIPYKPEFISKRICASEPINFDALKNAQWIVIQGVTEESITTLEKVYSNSRESLSQIRLEKIRLEKIRLEKIREEGEGEGEREIAATPLVPFGTPPVCEPSDSPKVLRESFQANWNATADRLELAKCSGFAKSRLRHINARANDANWMTDYPKALERLGQTFWFSRSDTGNGKHSGWKPNVDWFLAPDTVMAILEGKYDSRNECKPDLASRFRDDPDRNKFD